MRKILFILLLLFGISVVSCEDTNDNSGDNTEASPNSSAEQIAQCEAFATKLDECDALSNLGKTLSEMIRLCNQVTFDEQDECTFACDLELECELYTECLDPCIMGGNE